MATEEIKTLNVITVIEEPFVRYPDINFRATHRTTTSPGIVMDILREIGRELNLKYNIKIRQDGNWGEFIDGKWTGMIGMLDQKEVDILAGAVIVREDRANVIDYSVPFMSSESGMMIRSPDTVDENKTFLIISAPFEWQVWLTYLSIFFVSAFLLKMLLRPLIKSQAEKSLTWTESIWLFYSIMMQQEFKKPPTSLTIRTLLSFWYLIALTFAAIFTGNMIALFAVSKQKLPFNDVEGLIEKMMYDDYKVVLQNTSSSRINFIKKSNLSLFKSMWHEMSKNNKWVNVTTMEEGVREVLRNEKSVFIASKEALQINSASNCFLTTLDKGLSSVWFALAFQKFSNYTDLFSKRIQFLIESGFVEKWLNDYLIQIALETGDLCQFKEIAASADTNPISFKTAQGAFWIFIIGTILGFVGFVVEIIYYYSIRKKFTTTTEVERIRIVQNEHQKPESSSGLLKHSISSVQRKLESIRAKRMSLWSSETVESRL